jgi:hypothetical protein
VAQEIEVARHVASRELEEQDKEQAREEAVPIQIELHQPEHPEGRSNV